MACEFRILRDLDLRSGRIWAVLAMALVSLGSSLGSSGSDADQKLVSATVRLPFDQSGAKHTAVEEITLDAAGRLPLQGHPEERLYYVLDGRGVISIYEGFPQETSTSPAGFVGLYDTRRPA